MRARLNSGGALVTVRDLVQDEGGAYVETLSCGHTQFAAPYAAQKLRRGEIKTTVGTERKCWTCK